MRGLSRGLLKLRLVILRHPWTGFWHWNCPQCEAACFCKALCATHLVRVAGIILPCSELMAGDILKTAAWLGFCQQQRDFKKPGRHVGPRQYKEEWHAAPERDRKPRNGRCEGLVVP